MNVNKLGETSVFWFDSHRTQRNETKILKLFILVVSVGFRYTVYNKSRIKIQFGGQSDRCDQVLKCLLNIFWSLHDYGLIINQLWLFPVHFWNLQFLFLFFLSTKTSHSWIDFVVALWTKTTSVSFMNRIPNWSNLATFQL